MRSVRFYGFIVAAFIVANVLIFRFLSKNMEAYVEDRDLAARVERSGVGASLLQ